MENPNNPEKPEQDSIYETIPLARESLKLQVEPAAAPDMSLSILMTRHQEYEQRWKASREYRDYDAIFVNVISKLKFLKLEQAMCLGLGSLSKEDDLAAGEDQRGMGQLVVFESWLKMLEASHSIENIYFQDPQFTPLDKEFLTHLGYTVIKNPQSDELIMNNTFLFTPSAEQRVIDASLLAAHPSLFICGDLTKSFSYHPLPGYRDDTSGKIYWSKMVPVVNPGSQAVRRAYLEKHTFIISVDYDLPYGNWNKTEFVYYKPDSEAELSRRPIVFQYEGEEFHRDAVEKRLGL